MKIDFLGTSHGVPAPDRYCQSILVEIGERGYLIDAGAPVTDLLTRRGIDFARIKGVFITHMHGDHVNGLVHFLNLSSWYYKDVDLDVYLPDPAAVEQYQALLQMLHHRPIDFGRIRLHAYTAGAVFDDGVLSVKAIPTAHLENGLAYGFLLRGEGHSIRITGDMQKSLEDFPVWDPQEKVELLITECAHCKPEVLLERIEAYPAPRAAVTHVWPLPKYDVLAARAEDLNLSFPQDGDVYTLS